MLGRPVPLIYTARNFCGCGKGDRDGDGSWDEHGSEMRMWRKPTIRKELFLYSTATIISPTLGKGLKHCYTIEGEMGRY